MNRVIHRTEFHVEQRRGALPLGTRRVLTVALHRRSVARDLSGHMEVWYETCDDRSDEQYPYPGGIEVVLAVYGTGHELPNHPGRFVSTVFDDGYVWHFYVEGEVD